MVHLSIRTSSFWLHCWGLFVSYWYQQYFILVLIWIQTVTLTSGLFFILQASKDREVAMASNEERRALRDYVNPSLIGATSCIILPTIQANNFELKPGLIQMVQNTCQFGSFPNDDPNKHITSFLEIYDPQRINGVSMEVVKLNLFLSLRDKAKT